MIKNKRDRLLDLNKCICINLIDFYSDENVFIEIFGKDRIEELEGIHIRFDCNACFVPVSYEKKFVPLSKKLCHEYELYVVSDKKSIYVGWV